MPTPVPPPNRRARLQALVSSRAVALPALVALGAATAALAQPDPRVLTVPGLTQADIARSQLVEFPGTDVISFSGEFAPLVSSGPHRHPGTEILHVISGTGVLTQQGRGPVQLKPGMTVLSEPQTKGGSFVHEVRNTSSSEPLRTLIVLLVDTGEPPALPVQ